MNSSKSVGERPAEGERLSKRIMQLRDCSRREAEQYIEAGFVRVDGVVVQEPQFRGGRRPCQSAQPYVGHTDLEQACGMDRWLRAFARQEASGAVSTCW
jgi:hypothetical protein